MYMAMKGLDLKSLAIELEEDSRGIYLFIFITFYENNGLCSWIANEKW